MEENMFNKYQLIYEKPNSMTKELCKEFIELFTSETTLHPKISSITLLKNEQNNATEKKRKYLHKELCSHLDKYKNGINKSTRVLSSDNNKRDFKTTDLKSDDVEFIIQKDKYVNSEENMVFEKRVSKYTKILKFIWFLNDYDGEILFWREHKIRPTIGTFLLFPTSWCFPYEELLPINFERYIITGYIQNDF